MFDPENSPETQEAEHLAARARARELADLRHVLSSVEGRRFVWALLERSQVFSQAFAGEDTHLAAFRDGNRTHGLRLFRDVHETAPMRYVEMMVESQKPDEPDAPTA